jgi:hypothetical protein
LTIWAGDWSPDPIQSLNSHAATIRPDFSIERPDGSLAQAYDFKFPGDSASDMQQRLYNNKTSENLAIIEDEKCKCGAKSSGRPSS